MMRHPSPSSVVDGSSRDPCMSSNIFYRFEESENYPKRTGRGASYYYTVFYRWLLASYSNRCYKTRTGKEYNNGYLAKRKQK